MDDLFTFLFTMTLFNGLLCVAGFVADYILPHIPPIERWLNSLPMMDDDEGGE